MHAYNMHCVLVAGNKDESYFPAVVSIPAVWRNVREAAPVLVSVSCVVGVVWPFEKIVSPKKKKFKPVGRNKFYAERAYEYLCVQ